MEGSSKFSVLVFEINKKFLLFKILSNEFYQLLKDEIIKKFGSQYVSEKNNQSENFRRENLANQNGYRYENSQEVEETDVIREELEEQEEQENDNGSTTEVDDTADNISSSDTKKIKKRKKLFINNELIYEYFSPIVNSFEISKEINYTFEYTLFKNNQYIIRFNLHKNCLFMFIQDMSSNSEHDVFKSKSEMTNFIYSDFLSGWCCKSLISLLRYKFGICSDEKCFNNKTNKYEIKELFSAWSGYFHVEQVYFLEAIEQLEVSDDIKFKCKQFLDEFVEYMKRSETALSEYDYMDENSDELKSDFPFSFSNEDLNENESLSENSFNRDKLKITELENFFTDLSQINQFVLTYGNKLLFKYKKSYATNSSDLSSSSDDPLNIQSINFSIDSSSIFMLLLEAANFLEYSAVNPFKEGDDVAFKSRSISPLERSVIESESSNHENTSSGIEKHAEFSSYVDNFQSVGSSFTYLTPPNNFSPSSSSKKKNSFVNSFGKINENSILNSDEILNSLSIEKIKNFNKFKKTSSFLMNKNKSYSFYEILYLKLNENLCLVLLKANKLNKYCELISDFEALIENFIDLLNRKRLVLSAAETDSSTQNSFSPLVATGTATAVSSTSKPNSKKNIQDERIDKTFFSFFMNKLILFYDKLTNLKNELNTRNNSNTSAKGNGFFSKTAFKIKSRSFSTNISNDNTSDSYQKKSSRPINDSEISKQNSIKLIHTLQIKINQLSGSKHFKQFISYINNGQEAGPSTSGETFDPELNNDLLGCFRMIESQINVIRNNLNELFFELFLANFTTVRHELNTNSNDSSQDKNNQTPIFKSSHLINFLKDSFKKSLIHYTPFMDVKLKRNISMSFYWHQFPGLIHFSFINRQENTCVIPTFDKNYEYEISEYKINLAYRKYMPIVLTFLYKNDATQFHFTDDKLELIFSYHIWFEDRKSNYIPVDFNTINQLYSSYNDLLDKSTGKQFFENKNLIHQKSQLANIARDRNQNHFFGITEKSYYDLIKTLCYPNAPADSLNCYELACVHTNKLGEDIVKSQFKYLVANFCQKFLKNNL